MTEVTAAPAALVTAGMLAENLRERHLRVFNDAGDVVDTAGAAELIIGELAAAEQARGYSWTDPRPVSEAALTNALRGCWVSVYPANDGPAVGGYPAHPDRVASACLDWIDSPGNPARPEVPGTDTAPPQVLPPMDMARLAEIIAGVIRGSKLIPADPDRVVRAAIECAAVEAGREQQVTGVLDGLSTESRARILASLTARYRSDTGTVPATETKGEPS